MTSIVCPGFLVHHWFGNYSVICNFKASQLLFLHLVLYFYVRSNW